ncbi:MAG: hypothetical protein J6I49_00005 [Bacteroidales bacterium]|nr:hypothetical protein [Bacteroidales bacterium]
MAKLEMGILGPFRGKVGTVVGYVWKGRAVVRGYRRAVRYPNTENQRLEREWFVEMVRFAATARGALLLGLKEKAARWQMTEGNAFVKLNKGCFRRGGAVDYEHLVLSEGPAARVVSKSATVDADGVLRVEYERNGGQRHSRGGDRVYLYAYNTVTRQGLLSAPAERRQGRLAMQLPDGWTAADTQAWLLALDSDGRASASSYVPLDLGGAASSTFATALNSLEINAKEDDTYTLPMLSAQGVRLPAGQAPTAPDGNCGSGDPG